MQGSDSDASHTDTHACTQTCLSHGDVARCGHAHLRIARTHTRMHVHRRTVQHSDAVVGIATTALLFVVVVVCTHAFHIYARAHT